MTRTKVPELVNTATVRRPWIGRRINQWWLHSRGGFLASAMLFIAVLAGAIYLVLVPPSKPLPGAAIVGSAPDVVVPTVPAPTSDLMPSPAVTCSPQDPVQVLSEDLVTATYVASWYPVGTMVAPGSATGGPIQARRCFTRSPEGALYAVATRMVEDMVNTDLSRTLAEAGVTVGFSGYQWQSYTPDQAVVVLRLSAVGKIDTKQPAQIYTATWADNDWVVAPEVTDEAITAANDPRRVFTPWGGS